MTNIDAAIVPTVAPGKRLNVSQVDSQLTLANGMTAGYGVNDGHLDNWPFDPATYGNWRLQPNRVGFIRNTISLGQGVAGSFSGAGSGQYTLYFMYNPNQISISWQTDPSQGSPLYLYGQDLSNSANGAAPADSATVPAYATSQTVGWSLYFDRTYDMLYGNPEGTGHPEEDRGVLKDVAALYNLMGTFVASGTGSAVPFSTPCEVVFGQNGAGQLFGFTGYISSMNITYGIFRHDMIPSRAEVDLTLTATYVPNQVVSNGAGLNVSANSLNTSTQNALAGTNRNAAADVTGGSAFIATGFPA
jgi:hypothetical protein